MELIEELQAKILEEMDLSKEVEDDELMEIIRRNLSQKSQESHIPLCEMANIGKDIFNAFRKLDILQELLEDEDITEIMINGTDHIFVEKDGALMQLDKRFAERKKLEDIIQQIVAGANRAVNEATPIVDARLEDGSRVNVVLYPVALNGPIVTIRKFGKEAMTMQELLAKQSLSNDIAILLEQLVVSKYNIFISGGTGSG